MIQQMLTSSPQVNMWSQKRHGMPDRQQARACSGCDKSGQAAKNREGKATCKT